MRCRAIDGTRSIANVVCSHVVNRGKGKPPPRTWREIIADTLAWLAFGLFVLTLPLSFPALLVHKKLQKEKLRGKGAGALFLFWIGMTIVWIVIAALVDLYARKGFEGVQKALWVLLAWILWALFVLLLMRIIIEVIGGVVRIHRWWTSRKQK